MHRMARLALRRRSGRMAMDDGAIAWEGSESDLQTFMAAKEQLKMRLNMVRDMFKGRSPALEQQLNEVDHLLNKDRESGADHATKLEAFKQASDILQRIVETAHSAIF
jgi:hypothetical protein